MLSTVIAKLITRTLPADKWFGAAFTISKHYASVLKPPKKMPNSSYRNVQSRKLDTLLLAIAARTKSTPVFPIDTRLNGADLFKKSYPNGLVICSIHHPLVLLTVRGMVERGLIPAAILSKTLPKDGSGTIPILGTTTRIPVLFVDQAVLLKVAGILRQGGIIIILIDDMENGGYSTTIFHFIKRLKSDLLFSLVKLQPDGHIDAFIYELPVGTSSEEDVRLKVKAMDDYTNKLYNP